MTASKHGGMGSIPFDGGTAFRVWAPNAATVAVAGSFNEWNADGHQLTAEGNGYWSTDVLGVAPGAHYKYVLTGPQLQSPVWRNDPWAVLLTNSNGESVVTEADNVFWRTEYQTPTREDLIVYELHVGTFAIDPSHRGGRGHFDSVIAKLDYLRDLGVTAIELMPTDEFPGDVSWGYNPSYLLAIEESYGGPRGLARLIDAAHARGIAVIIDVVFNHFGPSDLDMWRFDGWYEGAGGGIFFYNDWRAETPWGDTRPDYGRGEVRAFIHDAAMRWLEERGCDGLRWDATGWIRNVRGNTGGADSELPDGWSLMQWINRDIGDRQPWKIRIAEDMSGDLALTADPRHGGAGFDAQWSADFVHGIREIVSEESDEARSMEYLAALVELRQGEGAFSRVLYTESHDEVASDSGQSRLPEEVSPGKGEDRWAQKRSTLAAAIMLTSPGIPMLFMGQEFLETGGWSDVRGLDWRRLNEFAGIHAFYRDLIRLRRDFDWNTSGLKGGGASVIHLNDRDKLLAYHRWDRGGPGDDVLVLANFSAVRFETYRFGAPRPGLWKVRFNGDWGGYGNGFTDCPSFDAHADPNPTDGSGHSIQVSIGPYSVLVLSQDR